MTDYMWLPGIDKIPGNGAGSFTGGGKKLVLHTTEGGASCETVADVLRRKNAWVHLIHDPIHKHTVQCLPFNIAGRGLAHTQAPETNRANCIQIEIVGFSYSSTAKQYGYGPKWAVENWGEEQYRNLAHLAARIKRNFNYPLTLRGFQRPTRFVGNQFVEFRGICGHMHVPGNDHGDPGTKFRGGYFRNLVKEMV